MSHEPMDLWGLFTFTLFVIPSLSLLLWLGVWQIHRLHWKENLLYDIKHHATATPVSLDKALAEAKSGADIKYLRVGLHGRFENDKERYLYAANTMGAGWNVITPFRDDNGTVVLVDRGFVPNALRDPAKRPQGQLKGEVTVIGLARVPQHRGIFTPNENRKDNRWYWRDLPGLSASMFPKDPPKIAPFFVDAELSNIPGGWPRGGQTNLKLPNNHLQYSATWFSLAAALVIVYILQVRKVVLHWRQERSKALS